MGELDTLLGRNREWADRISREDPGFFDRLSTQQTPKYLWIGCSDSRVPANQILGLDPGEVFVHRNIANVMSHGDLNALSVIQFAVDILKVEHILLVGHYGCGGVHAALTGARLGLADNWLRHVSDLAKKHVALLAGIESEPLRHARMCELNAIEQALNVCETTVVQDAWARGQRLAVHGWVYSLNDGRVRELGMDVSSPDDVYTTYRTALAAIAEIAAQGKRDD
ncbi:carbonate dehydratase [Luteimonas marina]|uniref:Carbonic anhydrase n=1 Tax=Luteimonas marina TaxID=488485 RepID=A0A5C5UDG5_9GAMM|nr:carbonate dehydratase [Luteimonas marina]TWT23743.1 carbonate dehydratase [Luteimonas marina]